MQVSISKGQIKKIKALARRVFGNNDDLYREMLWGVAKVRSCKDLSGPKIDLIIRHLEKCAGQGRKSPGAARAPESVTCAGPLRATERQLAAIRRWWNQISVFSPAERERALRNFLKRRFGVERLEWLTRQQATKVIEGMKAMARRGRP